MNSTNGNITGEATVRHGVQAPHSDARPSKRILGPRKAAVAALATALLLGTTACGASSAGSPAAGQSTAAAPPATATAPATSTSTAPATASASASAATSTAPPSGAWRTFTSADSKVTFDYPGSWSVSVPAGAAGSGAVDVDVANEAAVVVASFHSGPYGGLGGACQGAVPYTVLDMVEVNLPYLPSKGSVTPRFAFRALQETDRVTASYGLTSTLAGQNGTTCMYYNVVNGPAEAPMYSFADAFQVNTGGSEQIPNRKGAKTFPSMDAARAYMQTPEYLNAKRMITSLKINAG